MKRYIIFQITLLTSFWNYAQNSVGKVDSDFQIEYKFYYIEFIDKDNTALSRQVIKEVKTQLYQNGYIGGKEKNIWQGIQEIQANMNIKPNQVNKLCPYIHKFKDFSTYIGSRDNKKNNVEKILIVFNESKNGFINFNHHSFRKIGNKQWHNYSNANNFRNTSKKNYTTQDIVQWIVKTIVILTFK